LVHRLTALGAPEHQLARQQWVPESIDDVFAFFQDPHNLPRITPPDMGFEITRMVPDTVGLGTLISYRLRLFGVPCRWTTLIETWVPGEQFVDLQLKGPYVLWRHTHRFQPCNGGVLLQDSVRYRLPLGWLGSIAHRLVVRRTIERIFDYREQRIAELMANGRVVTEPDDVRRLSQCDGEAAPMGDV
jgi:uncharacterized protein